MFNNREGKRVPDVTFRTRAGCDWVAVTSREVFDGRSVVVFSVPGAFTRGMGILVDRDDLVFGQRSWRCSMLVRDGVIEKMFIDGKHIRGADELQSWLRNAAAA